MLIKAVCILIKAMCIGRQGSSWFASRKGGPLLRSTCYGLLSPFYECRYLQNLMDQGASVPAAFAQYALTKDTCQQTEASLSSKQMGDEGACISATGR